MANVMRFIVFQIPCSTLSFDIWNEYWVYNVTYTEMQVKKHDV